MANIEVCGGFVRTIRLIAEQTAEVERIKKRVMTWASQEGVRAFEEFVSSG